MTIQTHKRTCSLCEATCGIAVQHENGRILSIKGDKDDPFSKGYICPKATALQDLHEDPDRLRQPMIRRGDDWQEVSWDEALDFTARELMRIRDQYGRDAVASYLGNPNVHNYGNMLFGPMLLKAIGSKNKFSATSVDQLPHHMASLQMLGHQLLQPVADIDRTDFLIIMGGNPLASNGSMMTVPDFRGRIKAIQARGGRVLVIDPRVTETAKVADEHWFIRPGQDIQLLLAVLHVWVHELSAQLPALPDYVTPTDLSAICAGITPEHAAERTGISAEAIRRLAGDWLSAKSASGYGRMGLSVQQYGGLCQWLIMLLNIVSGNFDREGGLMLSHPAVDLPAILAARGSRGNFNRYQSRVRGLPEFGGELPVSVLGEEILTPGEGQVKALLTMAGNPVVSTPNSAQLVTALESLEFMVSIDYYLNETTRHAHVILPPCGPLERDHYDLIFNSFAVRNVAKYAPALFPPAKNVKEDWQIIHGLLKRMGRGSLKTRLQGRLVLGIMGWMKPSGILNTMLKRGPYKLSLKQLKAAESGMDLGPLRPSMPGRLFTRDKKLHLAPDLYLQELDKVRPQLLAQNVEDLVLIGRRHVRCNNSWLHNSRRLIKGPRRDRLMIHPDDAVRLGIAADAAVEVRSRVGKLVTEAEITEEVMPGVVSLPHGWGHNVDGVRLQTAREAGGVNTNVLTDDARLDGLTGNAALNGVPVSVSAVAG
jgi:anaerobic selenocysteine-containing dehydrogenase